MLDETQAKVDSGELQFEDWDKVKAELRDEFDRKWNPGRNAAQD
jgi:hypothetical protein